MNYKIRCVNKTEEFLKLEKAWKELEHKSNNKNLNSSFDWQITWWSVFKDKKNNEFGFNKDLLILLLYKNDNLIGIAPFLKVVRHTKYLLRKTSIEFVGQQWGATLIDFLGDLSKEEVSLFFKWVYENERFDYIHLQYIPEWTNNFNNELLLFSACPTIDIKQFDGFDNYSNKTFSKHLKQNLRTAKNKMNKEHYEYSCEIIENIEKDTLKKVKSLSLSKLKDKKDKHSIFTDHDKEMFYYLITKKINSQVVFICLKNDPKAYRVNFIYNNIKFCLDASYDRSFPRYELGSFSVLESVKNSFEKNLELHCEGTGIDFYKIKFCKTAILIYSYFKKGNSILSPLIDKKIERDIIRNSNSFMKDLEKQNL